MKWLQGLARPDGVAALETAVCHGVGGRAQEEDAHAYRLAPDSSGCWVVADGVGGQGAGEVAAHLAVEAVVQAFDAPRNPLEWLAAAVAAAHDAVAAGRSAGPGAADMASTIVALVIADGQAAWAHVGDSRLYHFRGGRLQARTEDHSLVELMIARGALAEAQRATFPRRHVILQALGETDEPRPGLSGPLVLTPDDAFLLCTDGFWEYLTVPVMEAALRATTTAADWLSQLEAALAAAQAADAPGAADNYTALAVRTTAQR